MRWPGCAIGGELAAGRLVLVCLSGRGDKDVAHVGRALGSTA